jgi:DNA-binding Lrp family transcriptional regulator
MERWTFLTNHAHVLLCIAADPGIRLVDVAGRVGITERSAQRIVADLIEEGYLKHCKIGRRNRYQVCPDLPLRHPVEWENAVGALLKLLSPKSVVAVDGVSSGNGKAIRVVRGRKQKKRPDARLRAGAGAR